jgi:hypothetical protein
MRTRALEIPVLYDDDKIVIDPDDPEPNDPDTAVLSRTMLGIPMQIGREGTRDMDMTLRHPAESHYFVRAGFESGAPTDVIADSIAAGEEWVVGPMCLAGDNWTFAIICLSDPDVPFERRIAAWRPIKVR